MTKAVTNTTHEDKTTLQKLVGVNLYTWAAFGGGADSGSPVQQAGKRGVFEVLGTFGAAIVLEGSTDNVTYTTMKDTNGNSMSYTAAALVETSLLPPFVRARDAGVTSVIAKLMVKD